MAYSTSDKVKSMFRFLDTGSGTSAITDSEIDTFIDEADAEIDGKLHEYYEVPITGTHSLKIMSKISTLKAAHLVRGVLDSVGQESEDEKAINFDQQAARLLMSCIPTKDSKTGAWVNAATSLYDATAKSVGPESSSVVSISITDTDPIFKKDVDAW